MDQTGYPGVDEHTFVLAANGKTPPPEGGDHVGIGTDSLRGTETMGFGTVQQAGRVPDRKR